MNWKMNTLNVRLSSNSDCVLCISEEGGEGGLTPTPGGQPEGQPLIHLPHGHDCHQVDLVTNDLDGRMKTKFCSF